MVSLVISPEPSSLVFWNQSSVDVSLVVLSTSTIGVDLKPSYPAEIAAKPYPAGYICPSQVMHTPST